MTGMTVAVLGVLAATGGLLRLVSLPLGGQRDLLRRDPRGRRVRPALRAAARHVRDGRLGGDHRRHRPWLPFQMLGTGWMGATAGLARPRTVHLRRATEVVVVAAFGWCWGFLYGAMLNLWFWPFQRDGGAALVDPGHRASARPCTTTGRSTSRRPPLGRGLRARRTRRSSCSPAARSCATLRRVAHRLDPVVELAPLDPVLEPARTDLGDTSPTSFVGK